MSCCCYSSSVCGYMDVCAKLRNETGNATHIHGSIKPRLFGSSPKCECVIELFILSISFFLSGCVLTRGSQSGYISSSSSIERQPASRVQLQTFRIHTVTIDLYIGIHTHTVRCYFCVCEEIVIYLYLAVLDVVFWDSFTTPTAKRIVSLAFDRLGHQSLST